jgi:hypothetical protein
VWLLLLVLRRYKVDLTGPCTRPLRALAFRWRLRWPDRVEVADPAAGSAT